MEESSLLKLAHLQLLLELSSHKVQEVSERTLEKSGHCSEVPFDVRSRHEAELGNLNELSEADHESPRVRTLRLEAFDEDRTHLLVYDVLLSLDIDVQNDATDLEGMVVRVSQFIDNGVQEGTARFITKVTHDGLESFPSLPLIFPRGLRTRLLLVGLPISNKQHNGADDIAVDSSSAVEYAIHFIRSLHFHADIVDQTLVLGSSVVFEVLLQA